MAYEPAMERASRLACLVILITITFATLCPIEWRPETGHPLMERAAAYLLLGLALGAGFPRKLGYTVLFVVAIAVALEALQLIDPGRDARMKDLVVKATAGMIGTVIPWLIAKLSFRAQAS